MNFSVEPPEAVNLGRFFIQRYSQTKRNRLAYQGDIDALTRQPDGSRQTLELALRGLYTQEAAA